MLIKNDKHSYYKPSWPELICACNAVLARSGFCAQLLFLHTDFKETVL